MKHILSLSYDSMVLSTRQMILESEGYRVTSALGFPDALEACVYGGDFDLVILGHSIPSKEKSGLITILRNYCKAPIVSLFGPGDAPVRGADIQVDLAEGPVALVNAVRSVLSFPGPQAS